MNNQNERIPTLDILRFLAAAAVVFFHFGFRGTIENMSDVFYPEFYWPARYGFWGVELFFVISGFVIGASATGRTTREFIAARAGRIYPAFFVCATITALVIGHLGMAPYSVTGFQWLTNITFTAPLFNQPLLDGVYWTLALELVFYAWVAFFMSIGIFKKQVNWIIVIWLCICMFNTLYVQSRPLKFLFLTEYGPYFASGLLLHRIYSGVDNFDTNVLFYLSILIGFLHPLDFEKTFPKLYGQSINVYVLCALHVGIYVVMGLALWLRKWVPPLRLFAILGGITYPLYLVHENVGFIFLNHLTPIVGRWLALAIVVAGVLILSWAIFRFIEPAGRKLIVRWVNEALGLLPFKKKRFSQLVPR